MEEKARGMTIEKDLKKRIKKTVRKILQGSSLYEMTELKAREEASALLGIDLSEDPYKLVVREVVESFIEETIKKNETREGKLQNQREIEEQKMDIDKEDEGIEKTEKKKKKKKEKEKKREGSDL